ncbi:MAG: hypothetical protein J6U97_04640 [Bacteroidaceae bacterium]|nr:hypothetical protein [Bacteroidaceae bacterium]
MTVTLYNCTSASNVLNKNMTKVQDNITATAKGVIDVDRPALLLDYSSVDFNYMFIQEFGRFYYVTSRALMPGQHIMINGESDPLESFKAGVKDLDVLAVRNEDVNKWNKHISDPLMVTVCKRETHGYKFGQMQDVAAVTDASYIIGVI